MVFIPKSKFLTLSLTQPSSRCMANHQQVFPFGCKVQIFLYSQLCPHPVREGPLNLVTLTTISHVNPLLEVFI